MTMALDPKLLEKLIFGAESGRRYTQDSPILPDVWIAYCKNPTERRDLILRPFWGTAAGELAGIVRRRLEHERAGPRARKMPPSHGIAHIHDNVAVELTLRELVRVVLPLTQWWRDRIEKQLDELGLSLGGRRAEPRRLVDALQAAQADRHAAGMRAPDLCWLAGLLGAFTEPDAWEPADGTDPDFDRLARGAFSILRGVRQERRAEATVWNVNYNRQVKLAVDRARLSVKADAAWRLFNITCSELTWAILDSGIDAWHPAFTTEGRSASEETEALSQSAEAAVAEGVGGNAGKAESRVISRYDFSQARRMFDPDLLTIAEAEKRAMTTPHLKRHLDSPKRRRRLEDDLKAAQNQLRQDRDLDWSLVAPLLAIDPEDRSRPANDHGTHVAGILGADWKQEKMKGVCPDIRLMDLRVLDDTGVGDEFSVIAALQFVRHLNAQHAFQRVHGVNLSLSIRHDVANFACGQTPVCEECERLSASGVVVVAAAGNEGFRRIPSPDGPLEGYHAISITDPGNAQSVITVGATHRYQPHTYGVSYFSSRGPTGDGRAKPDIVAPGEKIKAPTPDCRYAVKDGTSMAAPHVSGAAAMLMGRHMELVGQPQRIKEILCSTATDLGRERHFQGAGMLDVLRALQSV
jgi:serine protease AprX